MSKEELANKIRAFESVSTTPSVTKGKPLIVRLDGKNFSTFTKSLKKPFDPRFSEFMIDITKALVEEFAADFGYTQSDEITLSWHVYENSAKQYPFDGRFQKIESILAGFASAFMNKNLINYLPEKADQMPIFDCRAFEVDTKEDAIDAIIWRQNDCNKNAISMAARSIFSFNQVKFKKGKEMKEMLLNRGINFEDYPFYFKHGTMVKRVKEEKMLTDEELSRIPEKYRPTEPVLRSVINTMEIILDHKNGKIMF